MLSFSVFAILIAAVTALPPIIVDTDTDIDDLWAMIYLLKSGKLDVKAITVSSNGWSDAIFTVPNILRTLSVIGCDTTLLADIPVAYGSTIAEAYLDPSGGSSGAVPAAFKTTIDSYLTCLNLTLDINIRPSTYPAVELITRTLQSATEPVDILIMGGCTNIAHVLQQDRSLASKIGRIFMSGGNFDGRPEVPAFWPYTTKTKGSSWNVFVDPLSCHYVFSSGIPLYMHTGQAQDDLPVNATVVDTYVAQYNVPKILRDYVVQLAPCTNQAADAIQYWDPSAAMFAEQIILGEPNLCTAWINGTAIVGLTNGGYMGRTYLNNSGWQMSACTHSNRSYFEDQFWSTLGKSAASTRCLESVSFPNPTGLNEVSESVATMNNTISDLQTRIASLEAMVQSLTQNGSSSSILAPSFLLLLLCSIIF